MKGNVTFASSFAPVLAVLGAIIAMTVGTSYGKELFPAIGAEGTATVRVAYSAIILLAIWRPWRSQLTANDFKAIALYGATLGLMNLMFYLSLVTLPIGIAIAIEFTGPLSVAVYSSRKLIDFVWIGLAVVGLLLLLPLTADAEAINPIGVGFAVASAILWALYIIFGKRVGHLHAGVSTSWGMLFATMVVVPVGIFRAGAELVGPTVLLPGFILALASSAIPYTLEMFALKRLPKNTFGILLSMEPAVGALAGLIILHEQLSLIQWIAIGCIVAASIGSSLGAKSSSADPFN